MIAKKMLAHYELLHNVRTDFQCFEIALCGDNICADVFIGGGLTALMDSNKALLAAISVVKPFQTWVEV
jgi:hypothetical protein